MTKKIRNSISRQLVKFFCLVFISGLSAHTYAKNNLIQIDDLGFSYLKNSPISMAANVRLYAKNENLLLRFTNGNSVTFKPEKDAFAQRLFNKQTHHNEHLGRIETHKKYRTWHLNNTIDIKFLGSYPVAISTDGNHISLSYRNNELHHTNFPTTNYAQLPQSQARIIEQIQSALERAEQLVCSVEDTEIENSDEQCSNPEEPMPVGFGSPESPEELHINSRPANCHSYFTAYPSIERGTAIEAALANHPPYEGSESGSHSFPVADYWNNGNVYVLISRDLTADTYLPNLNPNGFYDQLISDGENIQNNLITPLASDGQISQTSLGETTTLYEEEAQVIYLDVIVQYGVMSDSQREQFNRAAEELLRLYGIILRLIMIP